MARRRKKNKIIQKSIGLLEVEWNYVKSVGENTDCSNSAAIRRMIADSLFLRNLFDLDEHEWIKKLYAEYMMKLMEDNFSFDNPEGKNNTEG